MRIPEQARCGSWDSPISAELVVAQGIRLFQPQLAGDRTYWLESRPRESGRTALVCRHPDGRREDVVPEPFSVRSRVHEYGGGAYLATDERVLFVENSDQQIYEVQPGSTPERLTAAARRRHADLQWDAARERIVCVCEAHGADGEPQNFLAAVGPEGDATALASGRDFYSGPRMAADGRHLAWLAWDHPNLPWDGTDLLVARVGADGGLGAPIRVAGGADEAICQPQWGPDGRLYFISDRDNWWNLYAWDGTAIRRVTSLDAELGLPLWVFGQSTYGFPRSDEIVFAATRLGRWQAYRCGLEGRRLKPLDLGLDAVEHLVAGQGRVVALAGDAVTAPGIIEVDAGGPQLISPAADSPVARSDLSLPQPVSFPSGGGATAHGLFYPATNPRYTPEAGELPPLLVKCHGGPTSATGTARDLRLQFWTSRGFAVLDLNYRGSTGYGRAYRRSLYGQWGLADVEDCVAGARHLAAEGRIDGQRLLISGGSAGGYTVLCALSFTDAFRAGASYYGIGDLESMFSTTHKFESCYDHWLMGPYPESRAIYEQRSPLKHVEKISCPVIFFQGAKDRVVPPQQSQAMVTALTARGVPVAYMEFPEESHGFRDATAIRRSLEAEYYFYCRILELPLPSVEPVEIRNLPQAP
jgi:dipeptidyl aminopeptidase/acylaminoacyl peptidase